MPTDTSQQSAIELLPHAIYAYLEEIEADAAICRNAEATAAIHDAGQSLQLYRMFARDEVTARQIRHATDDLPAWEDSIYCKGNRSKWMKAQAEIEARMPKHRQHPIITRGIEWEGMPILIHAYKFESDPVMKVELVLAPYQGPVPGLSLQIIAAMLRCHERIVPGYIATPLPPYERHETKFSTIPEYLSRTMPKELYATQCLQRVSCHASNGVGSRDTLREHRGALASHSEHDQKSGTT